MVKGYLALVLHAHLPFIRHPEHETFLEERWLFEAITESYVPLIDVFDGLVRDGVDFRLTISLSPTLINMLRDELLLSRYRAHLEKLITLANLEVERTRSDKRLNELARMYLEKFRRVKHVFKKKYRNDLVSAFKKFQDLGKIEIITCCATHGYLPFMDLCKPAVRAQIKIAVDTYKSVFGAGPKGMWLPECGFCPGHDEILKEFGIKYFFVETHGIFFGSPRPRYGVYSPYTCESGVSVFGRDRKSSRAVWSADEGYPGNPDYREFYRDIGFDLDHDYIRPFIDSGGTRVNTGIKYHRVTGRSEHKDIYNVERAAVTAAFHADNFAQERKKQAEEISAIMDRDPVIVSLFDAELFGHWWYEGPMWLDFLLRKMHVDQSGITTITPGEYLGLYEDYPAITPSASSWGLKGHSEVWLDGSNSWIYKHLHKMASLMVKAAAEFKDATGIEKRTLKQMARELLLAQSSDWAFIIKTGTFSDYATSRLKEHIGRFIALHDQLRNGNIDAEMLAEAEKKYNIFEEIDYGVYAA